jgi:hypothetical protein
MYINVSSNMSYLPLPQHYQMQGRSLRVDIPKQAQGNKNQVNVGGQTYK